MSQTLTPNIELFSKLRKIALPLLAFLLTATSVAVAQKGDRRNKHTSSTPSSTAARTLSLGKPILKEFAGGGVDTYSLSLAKGNYLNLVVEQLGIDVVVTLFEPGGQKLKEVDSPTGAQGNETLSLLIETSGVHKLEIRSLEKDAATGRYRVTVKDLRAATEPDKRRLSALQTYAEAEKLRNQGNPDAWRKSLQKYQETLSLLEIKQIDSPTASQPAKRNRRQPAAKNAGQANKADQELAANALYYIGQNYTSLGENRNALAYFTKAATLYEVIGERQSQAETLVSLGAAYNDLSDRQKALENDNQALNIFRAIHNLSGEAMALNNIGLVYQYLGEVDKALDAYNKSLQIRESLANQKAANDRYGKAITLSNLGTIYNDKGDAEKALSYFNQALPVFREIGNRYAEASTLSQLGILYNTMGEKQKALDFFNQVLAMQRAVDDHDGIAKAMNDIGSVYASLGETQKALDFFKQAIAAVRLTGNRYGEAAALANIGSSYLDVPDYQKALDCFNQTLTIRRAISDRNGEGCTLNSLGRTYELMGNRMKALEYYNQALPILQAVGNRRWEAHTLMGLGWAQAAVNDPQQALEYYNKALAIRREIGDRGGEAMTIFRIAGLERDRGNLTEATQKLEEALKIIELLRTKIGSDELRASYFASVRDYYETYIDVLMQRHRQNPAAGFDALALRASEKARARSLLEMLADARANIRQGIDPALLERERLLKKKISDKAVTEIQWAGGKFNQEQSKQLAREIQALTIEYQEVEAQIKAKAPRNAAMKTFEPLNLTEIQQRVLDQDTLLLEFSLGETRSYLWAVTRTEMRSYELPKRQEIEVAARRFYNLLMIPTRQTKSKRQVDLATQVQAEARNQELAQAGLKLSQMILGAVASQMEDKRLLVVADGALNYIPFAALPNPEMRKPAARIKDPLIVDHEIVSLPSASTLAAVRQQTAGRKPAPKALAVIADPVFDDHDGRLLAVQQGKTVGKSTKPTIKAADSSLARDIRLKVETAASQVGFTPASNGEVLPRLPGTRREAEKILSYSAASERKQALDFAASRETVTSAELGQYRIIHFATHGFLNSLRPELSGIVLSLVNERGEPQDGFLLANEIYNLKLPADLVVLSACESGLGKEVKGEGFVGLTRGFMYAGAARVMVSLWEVADDATAELMARFYKGVLKEKMRPAAALREAQIHIFKQKQWEAPFFWAAFVLQGEWD